MADDIREAVASYFEQVARWRDEKAEDYPEDPRNRRAAAGLREAAAYVRSLDPTDSRLVLIDQAQAGFEDDYPQFVPSRESEGWDVSQFRFRQSVESVDAFLTRFAEGCIASRRGFDTEHANDCAAFGDEPCEPFSGQWMQPEDVFVRAAKDELPDVTPWCRVRERAWELQREAEGESA